MSPLPSPPAEPPLTWRPWSAADAPALARHTLRIHESERLGEVTGADGFLWMMGQEGFDPAVNSIAAFDASGEVQADAGTWCHVTDSGGRVFVWAETGPGHEHLRPFLVSWVEAQARLRLEPTGAGLPRVIRASIDAHRTGAGEAFRAAGFAAQRSFATMRRSMSDLPPITPPPPGITIVPWSEDLDDAVRQANNEAFADHWGSLPMSPEAWTAMFSRSPAFRPECSFVALDADQVASFSITEFDPETVASKGIVEFYLDKLGTRRAHRRRGLGSLLVIRTLHAAAAVGAEAVGLDVDEESHTDATSVYARLGFGVVERATQFVMEI